MWPNDDDDNRWEQRVMAEQFTQKFVALRKLINETVECGCCTINPEAVNRVADYMMTIYPDKTVSDLQEDRYTDLMGELYLFVVADRDLEIRPIPMSGPRFHPLKG
jgi:hypothetical protein